MFCFDKYYKESTPEVNNSVTKNNQNSELIKQPSWSQEQNKRTYKNTSINNEIPQNTLSSQEENDNKQILSNKNSNLERDQKSSGRKYNNVPNNASTYNTNRYHTNNNNKGMAIGGIIIGFLSLIGLIVVVKKIVS